MRKKKFSIIKRKTKDGNNRLFRSDKTSKVFSRKRKNIKLDLKINLMYGLYVFIFIIICTVAFLFLGNTFKIQKIEIIRKDNLSNINIAYNSLDIIRNKYIFNVEKQYIKEKLKEYQKNLNTIEIEKEIPDTIKIEIGSFESIFNTIINKEDYIITSNGVLVKSQHSDKLINLQIKGPIKTDNIFSLDHNNIISEEISKKIIESHKRIKENIIGIKIDYLSYYPIEREIHFFINNKTLLILDLTKDIKKQVKNLVVFNSNHFELMKDDLIYIDLRIENKIFYCNKENEYKCNLNLTFLYK